MKKLVLILMLIISENVFSQIAVNPAVIFIDPESKSGHITLTNRGTEQKQVEVYFKFGYTVTDSLGVSRVIYGDSLPLNSNSLMPYIKVFPKKIILGSEKEQTIRFLLKNTSSLRDGTYWTRVVIKASPLLNQLDTNKNKIQTQMIFITESNTIAVYEKGRVNTELNLQSVESSIDSQNVNLLLDFTKNGNSPFWGTVNINVYDKDEELIDVKSEIIPVYVDGKRKFSFDKKRFPNGDYSAEIIINSEHPDIKDDYKIKIRPIEATYKFKIENNLTE